VVFVIIVAFVPERAAVAVRSVCRY